MEGVENVELHAGHHEVVQWLGLTFNMDTLIATWVTMAIVILITVLATRGRKLVPVGLQNIVESILEGSEFGSPLADGEFLVIYVFLIYFCRK